MLRRRFDDVVSFFTHGYFTIQNARTRSKAKLCGYNSPHVIHQTLRMRDRAQAFRRDRRSRLEFSRGEPPAAPSSVFCTAARPRPCRSGRARFADRFHVIALDQRGHVESHGRAGRPTRPKTSRPICWGHRPLVGAGSRSSATRWAAQAMSFRPGTRPRERARDRRLAPGHPDRSADRLRRRASARCGRTPRSRPRPGPSACYARTAADPAFLAHLGPRGRRARRSLGLSLRSASNSGRRPVDAWSLLDRIARADPDRARELSPVLRASWPNKLRAAIRRATLVEIPASYHHLVLDNPPDSFRALEEFLTASMPTQ